MSRLFITIPSYSINCIVAGGAPPHIGTPASCNLCNLYSGYGRYQRHKISDADFLTPPQYYHTANSVHMAIPIYQDRALLTCNEVYK